jgi:hypothetical protein
MTLARIGYGASFGVEGNTPGTYDALAEVVAITPPGMTREAVDATHLLSPDAWREFIAGLKDQGEASLTLNFIATNYPTLMALFGVGTGNFQITTPSGAALRFAGIVTAVNPPELAPESKMEMTITIKASGAPSFIAAPVSAPTNTTLPAVSGTVQEGQTLTAWPGVWTGSPSFAYQWQELISASWTNISGASNPTLVVPGGATIGRPLRVVVTGSNAGGSATANSAATVNVIAA